MQKITAHSLNPQKTGRPGFISAVTAVLWAVCMAVSSFPANAQPDIAPSPCDPGYYDSLEARAWLEAQREVMQNENLIYKPDSVLEYTCFNQFLNVLSNAAPSMFSQTSRWTTPPPGNMGSTLSNLVGGALSSYIGSNFGHPYLGGRETGVSDPPGGGSYNCEVMYDVWMKAKCYDFVQSPDNDGFFTFAEYTTGSDKRFKPDVCPAGNPSTQDRISDAIENAANTADPQLWTEDAVVTFFENLDPAECSNADAIATGIVVRRTQTPQEYNEKVCLAPGCYYVPSGVDSGSCQSSL